MKRYLLIFLMLIGANAFAEVSKWVDANGRVHYSDRPPADMKVKTLRAVDSESASDGAASSVPAAPKTIAEREAELKKAQKAKQEAADKAAQKQAIEDADKARCATAQQNLRTLQEGVRIMEMDANGERSVLGDEQRQQRIEKAQQSISAYCK